MSQRIYILPLLLALLITCSSIGSCMVMHECFMSGDKSMAFSMESIECCKNETPAKAAAEHSTEDDDCCRSTEQYKSLDTSTHKVNLSTDEVLPVFVLLFEFNFPESAPQSGTSIANHYLRVPIPPPAGRQLLAKTGLLRI